ncbi:MAG: type I 3-dehydroquinate dehydratase, partial [Thermoplasmata archaeon]
MSARTPQIVVTLPGRTVGEVKLQAEAALRAGADLAEVRFDRWTAEERAGAAAIFPAPLPLVATLRSTAEGGEGADDPYERLREVEGLVALPFRWIDVEEARDDPLARRLLGVSSLGRIVSTHLPNGASTSELEPILARVPPPGA